MAGEREHSLFEVFLSGIDVSKKLGQAHDGFPRNVEVLIDLVEKGLSITQPYKIYFHPRNYSASAFIGTVEAFENEAHIYYDRNQKFCWRRFIVVKEMCHLLFATAGEKHLASTPEQIDRLVIQILAGIENGDFTQDHIASTETCTVYMALEVLLPHSERPNVEKMIADKKSNLDVATFYRIPELMVGLFLNQGYAAMMESSYKAAGKK
jgi:hypothetical protein